MAIYLRLSSTISKFKKKINGKKNKNFADYWKKEENNGKYRKKYELLKIIQKKCVSEKKKNLDFFQNWKYIMINNNNLKKIYLKKYYQYWKKNVYCKKIQ